MMNTQRTIDVLYILVDKYHKK